MADLSVGGTYEAWRDELINAVIMGDYIAVTIFQIIVPFL